MKTNSPADRAMPPTTHEAHRAGRDAFHRVPDSARDDRKPRMFSAYAAIDAWRLRDRWTAYADKAACFSDVCWPYQGRGGTRPYRRFINIGVPSRTSRFALRLGFPLIELLVVGDRPPRDPELSWEAVAHGANLSTKLGRLRKVTSRWPQLRW